MSQKWLSRKFLLTVSGALAALSVVVGSIAQGNIEAAGEALLALVGIIATYNAAEGASDYIERKGQSEITKKNAELKYMQVQYGTSDDNEDVVIEPAN